MVLEDLDTIMRPENNISKLHATIDVIHELTVQQLTVDFAPKHISTDKLALYVSLSPKDNKSLVGNQSRADRYLCNRLTTALESLSQKGAYTIRASYSTGIPAFFEAELQYDSHHFHIQTNQGVKFED